MANSNNCFENASIYEHECEERQFDSDSLSIVSKRNLTAGCSTSTN